MSVALIPGFPTVGGAELIIFLVIILLLFGAKRIPELAKGLGSGVREFRQGVKGGGDEEAKKDEELEPGASKDEDGAPAAQEVGAERKSERAEQTERSEQSR